MAIQRIQTIDENGKVWNSDPIETEYTPEMTFAAAASTLGRQHGGYTHRVFDGEGVLLLEMSARPRMTAGWLKTGGRG